MKANLVRSAVVAVSLALAAGFIAYRAGAFDAQQSEAAAPASAAPVFMSGSKREELPRQGDFQSPVPQP